MSSLLYNKLFALLLISIFVFKLSDMHRLNKYILIISNKLNL